MNTAASTKLHLRVLHNVSEDHDPSQINAICNVRRTEIAWNLDFTAFRLIPLKWWDDASYADSQLDAVDTGAGNVWREGLEAAAAAPDPEPAFAGDACDDDGLMF